MIRFNNPTKLCHSHPKTVFASYNLFWWKVEGFESMNGLNVYRLSDKNSAGFVLRFGRFQFRVRYSKRTKKIHWGLL